MSFADDYRSLREAGQTDKALALAREVLPRLDGPTAARAGKWILRDLATENPSQKPVRVLLLGQCTTQYLPPLLAAWAWHEGLILDIVDAEYDQILQTLLAQSEAPDLIVLLPWNQRLLAPGDRSPGARLADELEFWRLCWNQIARLQCKAIQIGYDWTGPGGTGYSLSNREGGDIALIREMNRQLLSALPPGTYFVDVESASASLGKHAFYDSRNHLLLRQPFSPDGLSLLARHVAAGIRALTAGRRKVLALDLDNTLWGGVIGETGPQGIAVGGTGLGEAFQLFQIQVKRLRETGILLVALSKNNEEDAKAAFLENDRMVLKLEDFAAFHASWNGKPGELRSVAKELNLGTDSFVYFDDNPAERAHMRAELPEVLTIEAPEDPADFVAALVEALPFETVGLTAADAERSRYYAEEQTRREALTSSSSPEDYLRSLGMTARCHALDSSNLDRVTDLVTKTNQFNLTTKRHSRAEIETFAGTPGSVCFAVELADKFGDYGLIAVILALPEAEALRIDTWLMSCRAMGRTVEHFTLNEIARSGRTAGYQRLLAEYFPTAKNAPVASLLTSFGFSGDSPAELDLTSFTPLPHHLTGPAVPPQA